MTAPKTIPKNPMAEDQKAYEDAYNEPEGDVKVAGVVMPPIIIPRAGYVPPSRAQRERRKMTPEQKEDAEIESGRFMDREVFPADQKAKEERYRERQELNKLKSSGGLR